jgi:hypothetical protein
MFTPARFDEAQLVCKSYYVVFQFLSLPDLPGFDFYLDKCNPCHNAVDAFQYLIACTFYINP